MEQPSAHRPPKHPSRWSRRRSETGHYLRKLIRQHGRNVPREFMQGVAYKLGSGAVTLLILWWQTGR